MNKIKTFSGGSTHKHITRTIKVNITYGIRNEQAKRIKNKT